MTETEMLRAQVETLTKQLAAATNDAARAELRAKDAVARITKLSLLKEMDSPDSDARLREVMLRVAEWVHEVVMFAPEPVIKSELPEIVDEVLGVKP